jgi:putative transposase
MEKAYKFRIVPTKEQEHQILNTFGCCRFVYNHYLDIRKKAFKGENKTFNYNACSSDMTALKKEKTWLKNVDSTALQSSIKNLDNAYKNFFRRVKTNSKPFGYPTFKSKKSNYQSYISKTVGKNIEVFENWVKLPKLGFVKCKISKKVEGRIISATVSRNPADKFFVSICCTNVNIQKLPKTGKTIGLDLGIKSLLVTSDSEFFENHKYLRKSEKKLIKLQRSLSRKSKGSNNRAKARIKVAKHHERIANQRNDKLHKISIELVKKHDIICTETLKIKNMIKNRKLSKSIADASWGEFLRQLTYKCKWYGKICQKIDKFFASSQICNNCGEKNPNVKDLKIRNWICSKCNESHDRDVNAAKNILAEGLQILKNLA